MEEKIHIGRLIKQKLLEQERSGAWLARKINTSPSNVSKILTKEYLDTGLLLRISKALNYDFFAIYSHIFKR